MVAGAVKADLLADLASAVDKSIEQGTGLEAFRKDFREIVARHGWTGWTGQGSTKGEAWRTRVIYRTNMATSYAAGRMAQLRQSGYPLWIYRHGGSREPRLQHLDWDGLILEADHPFWITHAPPNGWGCSCYVIGARSRSAARRRGGDPDKTLPDGWQSLDPRTGAPVGIDRGWAYAPGRSSADPIIAVRDKLPGLPAPIGAALWHSLPSASRQSKALDDAFAAFVDQALSQPVRRDHMVVGALKPAWIDEARSRGVEVQSAEIAVSDLNIQHTFRGTGHVTAPSTRKVDRRPKVGALDLDWYRALPSHLRHPSAVLIDTTGAEPVIILVFDLPGRPAKLVIEVNTWVKKTKGHYNTVQSGRTVDLLDLTASLNRDGVDLIEGRLE